MLQHLNNIYALLSVAVIGVAVYAVVFLVLKKGNIRVKDGQKEMVIGDNTPFEKTNQRFKQMVENSARMVENFSKIMLLSQELLTEIKAMKVVNSQQDIAINSIIENRKETRQILEDLRKESEYQNNRMNELWLEQMKSLIINPDLNDDFRMRIFLSYKKKGGNDWVDEWMSKKYGKDFSRELRWE